MRCHSRARVRTVSLAALVLVAVGLSWAHVFGYRGWVTPAVWPITGLITAAAVASLVAAWRMSGRMHVTIAAAVLGVHAVIVALMVSGVRVVALDLYPSVVVACVSIGLSVLAVTGLVLRRVWGRWLGLALGAISIGSGGLNTVNYWHWIGHVDSHHLAWSNTTIEAGWAMLVGLLGGLVIVASLLAPAARDHTAGAPGDAAWTGDARLARLVRPMLVAALVALPMLLVYALVQPIAPETQTTALVLAGGLGLGALLVMRGKLVGAVVLVIAGFGLIAQTAATFAYAPYGWHGIADYYAVFWLPAGACAVLCAMRLARPTLRLLKD